MKLIFLDIDGVLNSDKYIRSGQFVEDKPVTHIDPEAVSILNQLVNQSQASVVLSSTWRLLFSLSKMNSMLSKRGATFRLIGKTPPPRKMSSNFREWEVQEYLEKRLDAQFVILDDLGYQFDKLKPNLVLTDESVGLTTQDVKKALDILK